MCVCASGGVCLAPSRAPCAPRAPRASARRRVERVAAAVPHQNLGPTRPREHGVPCQPARLNVAAAQEESTCRMGGAGPRRAATAAPRPRHTRPATTSPRHVPSARRSVAGARAPSGAARHGCPGGCAVPAAAAAGACWADTPVAAEPGLRGGRVRGCGPIICSMLGPPRPYSGGAWVLPLRVGYPQGKN